MNKRPSDIIKVCCILCEKSVPICESIPQHKPFTYICLKCKTKG